MEAPPLNPSRHGFAEATKWFPVAFVSSIICILYLIYMHYHILPNLAASSMAISFEVVIFNIVTALLCVCYWWCINVEPGTIPTREEDPNWGQDQQSFANAGAQLEWKRTGDRRQCKWCAKYKPDRSHHCRVCRKCILKMDHHCPWIYNCVGFKNHKYFFLLLLYASIDCNIIAWSMSETVLLSLQPKTPFLVMFLALFGETLAVFLGVIVTAFLGFHIFLMMNAMTTIEFCEKSTKKTGYNSQIYDRGPLGNIKDVLGECVWLWLLPLSPPPGNGLIFVNEETLLRGSTKPPQGSGGGSGGGDILGFCGNKA